MELIMLLLCIRGSILRPAGAFQWHTASISFARRSTTRLYSSATEDEDAAFMKIAVSHARKGFGHTFPNPAVGCVLVKQETNAVIGQGFHPQAGLPHAEVFALLEACGHVPSGVDAAMSVIQNDNTGLLETVQDLSRQYAEDGGAQTLFGDAFATTQVTAYVTLEPCSHYGKTPPCAASLVLSKVDRVVVGFRDPNPRVDGGGVRLLQDAGISVDFIQEGEECAKLVECFLKRITPRENDYLRVTGSMRRALRSLAGRRKTQDALAVRTWPSRHGSSIALDEEKDLMAAVDSLSIDPSWLEEVDACLWDNELMMLRLNKAVGKKKGTKRLGERIARELDAHVAQVVGHTILLYRPGIPPIMDLEKLVEEQQSKDD